jgi:hypothetical protein
VIDAHTALMHSPYMSLSMAAYAAVAFATTASPPRPADPVHGGCAPVACTLELPTPDERRAILAEADRLVARYADDTTALGGQCRALGTAMRERIGDVRMLPVMWRAIDPDGNLAAVTGDAHLVEPSTGAGRVHIARGYDLLNPERGLDAIVETARHEFAHLIGMGRAERFGLDEGALLAAACASDAAAGPAAPR